MVGIRQTRVLRTPCAPDDAAALYGAGIADYGAPLTCFGCQAPINGSADIALLDVDTGEPAPWLGDGATRHEEYYHHVEGRCVTDVTPSVRTSN